jgi:hypothetical protein
MLEEVNIDQLLNHICARVSDYVCFPPDYQWCQGETTYHYHSNVRLFKCTAGGELEVH